MRHATVATEHGIRFYPVLFLDIVTRSLWTQSEWVVIFHLGYSHKHFSFVFSTHSTIIVLINQLRDTIHVMKKTHVC